MSCTVSLADVLHEKRSLPRSSAHACLHNICPCAKSACPCLHFPGRAGRYSSCRCPAGFSQLVMNSRRPPFLQDEPGGMLSSDALMAALTAEYERRLEVNHASLVALFTAVDTNADWTINRVGHSPLGSDLCHMQNRLLCGRRLVHSRLGQAI